MILIINKSKKDARSLAEMFYIMGVIAYPEAPSEALSEISLSYSAVIVMNPSLLADKEDYVARLRSYASVPIFAYCDEPDVTDTIIFDGILKSASYASSILAKITEHNESRGLKAPGIYRLAGVDASSTLQAPLYFGTPLALTKTEAMVLRALIVSYPNPSGAKDILKYAFRQSKVPEASNIRTHISIINKKFREITDRNLISSSLGTGYLILTPEIKEAITK